MATQSTKPRLSVAMIVRNEQDVLAETLDSIHSIADEVLVLDTGSTDQTATLAAEWGATVIHTPWPNDFSAARNQLLADARGDWILWLDAGERLAAGSGKILRQFVEEQADPEAIYYLMVEVPAAAPSGYAEQAARPRLMPRNPGLRFEGPVGESVRASAEAAGLKTAPAPVRILCHPRRNDPRRKAAKAWRDLRMIAAYRAQGNPLRPRLLVTLGEAYVNFTQPILAELAFVQAVRTAPKGSTEMLEGYYGLLTALAFDPTQRDRQLLACTEALEVYPFDVQLLCAVGGYLQARGRLDLAERSFRLAVQFGQVDTETWHLVDIAELGASCLGLALQLQGKDDEACEVLSEALQRSPYSQRLRRQLVDLEIKHGRDDEAIRSAEALAEGSDARHWLSESAAGACKAARQLWDEAIAHLQGAYTAGCRDPLCLRWLSVAMLSAGRHEAAELVVREWHRLEPANHEAKTYLSVLQNRPRVPQGEAETPRVEHDRPRRIRFDAAQSLTEAVLAPMPVVSRRSTLDAGVES